LGELACAKEEKALLKEHLVFVDDNRDSMEKRNEKEIVLLSTELKHQSGLRCENALQKEEKAI